MASEIWREFDPNFDIPIGLRNAKSVAPVEEESPFDDIDIQTETIDDDESSTEDDGFDDELEVPGTFEVISQTIRTAADGSQVVDVIIDVEEVEGADKYEIRITK